MTNLQRTVSRENTLELYSIFLLKFILVFQFSNFICKDCTQKKLEYDTETLEKFVEFMADNHFNAILKLNEELKQKLDEVQLGGQYNDGLGNQADGSLISPEQIQKSL